MRLSGLALAISLAYGTAQAQNYEFAQITRLKQIGIDQAWARNLRGQGSIIGIVDQGFDLKHYDLKGQVSTALNFAGSSPVTSGLHGTNMASIAAGLSNNQGSVGAAPGAKLLLAQVGAGGTNTMMSPTAVNRALDWLSANGAHVINLSFGGEYTSAWIQSTRYDSKSKTYIGPAVPNNLPAFVQATQRGSILVMAAGNQALPYSQAPAIYAANTDSAGSLTLAGRAIIVGSVDANNQISSFSNRAGHICQTVITGTCRDTQQTMNFFVVAPGEKLMAAAPGSMTTSVSGTSGAAAMVSGGIALMRQAWPHLRPEQIVNLLLTTTRDLGAVGTDPIYGRGLVDFNRATAPSGQLIIARANQKLGQSSITGSSVNMSAISSDLAFLLRSTSLSRAQVVDQIGRNYQADLTQLKLANKMGYDPASPYMSMTGYQTAYFDLYSYSMAVLTADRASAVTLTRYFPKFNLSYQLGGRQESQGFVGNYGVGALDLGNSYTSWQILSLGYNLTDQTSIIAGYGQGISRLQNNPASIIQTSSNVVTDTWQLGLQRTNFIVHRDKFEFGVAGDIRIKKGSAKITTVQGYDYSESESGDVVAMPQTITESVNLQQQHQPVLWSSYKIPVTKNAFVITSGAVNKESYRLGVNFTWLQ